MKYGYARVSTVKQGKDGFSLEDQKQELVAAGAEKVFSDTWTGTTLNRPEFDKLMKEIQPGDELIVCKLDRFARTAGEGCILIQQLRKKGIIVNVLNMGRADNTPLGKLVVTMLLAFSEFERDMIIERTQTGKARARENGVRVDGRPQKFSDAKLNHALDLVHSGTSYNQVVAMTGISKSTIIRAERKWKAQHSQPVEAAEPVKTTNNFVGTKLMPYNICTALFETDPAVFSYLCDNPEYTATNPVQEKIITISILTENLSDISAAKNPSDINKLKRKLNAIRKKRDQKLDELCMMVQSHIKKTSKA